MLIIHFPGYSATGNPTETASDTPKSYVQMFEEYQQRALPVKLTEHLEKRLQSDSEIQSEAIRQTKENMESIINSIFPDAMKEISQEWHQLHGPQASSLAAPDGHHTPLSRSMSYQPHHDIGRFYTAPSPVPESSSVSLSDLNPRGQQFLSTKAATDSGYYSANTLMYGQIPEHSAYGPSPGQSVDASQPHHFAPPGSSAFSGTPSASIGTNQFSPEFMQLDFDLRRSLTMEPATQLREPHSSISAVEQPGLGSVGNASQWTLDRSQGGFDSPFQAVADGTQDTEPFSDLLNFDADS